MARTSITKQIPKGPYPTLPLSANSADVTMTAADVSNKNQAICGERDLLIAQNTGGVAYTVTISSYPDSLGRSGDITTYQLDAGDIAVFGPFQSPGWRQADSYLYFEANNAAVKFAVLDLSSFT